MWKDIDNFENYKISNFGNVKSFTKRKSGNNLIPQISRKGYQTVLLYNNGKPHQKKIHRLVAAAFISNKDKLPQVNHIDGNKQNNRVDNLEWCDNSYNQIHAYKTGLERPKFQRKIKQYSLEGEYIAEFNYIREAKRYLNIDGSSISACCRGKRKSAGGFIWKYADDNNSTKK